MDHVFTIVGMQSSKCVDRVSRVLKPFARHVQVTFDPPRAVLRDLDADATLEVLNIAAAGAGKYTLEVDHKSIHAPHLWADSGDSWFGVYKPFFLLTAFLLGVTLLIHSRFPGRSWHDWMSDFLASYFFVFAFFKLLDLSGFATVFRGYDLIAAKSVFYAYAYPFIELALGTAYIIRWNPVATNGITLIVMLVSVAGVVNALRKRKLIERACLGTVFRLPMSKSTLIEKLSMAMMAAALLVYV